MLNRLRYFVGTALRGMRRSPVRAFAAAGAIAVALAVLGGYLLVYVNLDSLLGTWGRDLDLSVFLKDGLGAAERTAIEQDLARRPEVEKVRFVGRGLALERLRRDWREHAQLLTGAAAEVVEESFEVRLKPAAERRRVLTALARHAGALPGVAAVDYGEQELVRVERAMDLLRSAGGVLAALLSLAALFVIGVTIRLAIRDRREELEIMKLCGATDAFIRVPLYLEGALEGALGGALALALVAGLHGFLGRAMVEVLGGVSPVGTLAFPLHLLAAIAVGGGAALGALGSAVAAGRYLKP